MNITYILTAGKGDQEEDDTVYIDKFLAASKDKNKINKLKEKYVKNYNKFAASYEKAEQKRDEQDAQNIKTVREFLIRNKQYLQEYNPDSRKSKAKNSWRHENGTPYNPIIEDWEKDKLIDKLTTGINHSIHLFWPQYKYSTGENSLSNILFLDKLEEDLPDIPCYVDIKLPQRPEGVYTEDELLIVEVESID
jgi:hypothetical protein